MKPLKISILRRRNWKRMPDPFPHNESVLQLLWQKLLFSTQSLRTTDGKQVQIIHPGTLNTTDGPDFKHASIVIDGIKWHGSVELHLRSSGWKEHRHHLDNNYDKVILHVVAEDNPRPVYTKSGISIPTLNLLLYLTQETNIFLESLNSSVQIPCGNNLSYITEDALERQMQKAHQEYFEKKVEDLISFYDPALSLERAWKSAFILAVFDGFGIPHNRSAMVAVGQKMIEMKAKYESYDHEKLKVYAFSEPELSSAWNYRSVHPVSHPSRIIGYAWSISEQIMKVSLKDLLTNSDHDFWSDWTREAGIVNHYKSRILKATVYLPALYFLGSLFHSRKLMGMTESVWSEYRVPIPKSVQNKLRAFGEKQAKKYKNQLGSVYQLRSYCKQRKCHECEVLKKVISS